MQIKLLGMNLCDKQEEPIMYVKFQSRGERMLLCVIAFVAGIMVGTLLSYFIKL